MDNIDMILDALVRPGASGISRNMKKGISQLSFLDDMAIGDVLELSKKSGFEGVELMLKEEGELSLDSSEKEIEAIKKLAQDIGIEIASLVSLIPWDRR